MYSLHAVHFMKRTMTMSSYEFFADIVEFSICFLWHEIARVYRNVARRKTSSSSSICAHLIEFIVCQSRNTFIMTFVDYCCHVIVVLAMGTSSVAITFCNTVAGLVSSLHCSVMNMMVI